MRNSPVSINSTEKYCSKCEQTLSISSFRIRPSGTAYDAYCLDCTREYNRSYYRRNPYHAPSKMHPPKDAIRAHARNLLQSAVRWGKMKRQPCIKCGKEEAQGHHEDYSKPYDVVWLCRTHHGEVHWKVRAWATELK